MQVFFVHEADRIGLPIIPNDHRELSFAITNPIPLEELLGITEEEVYNGNASAIIEDLQIQISDFTIMFDATKETFNTAEMRILHINKNYIYISNANRTIEHQRVRVGDEFLGLTLEDIESSVVVYEEGKLLGNYQLIATFSGDLVLGGDWNVRYNSLARSRSIFFFDENHSYIIPEVHNRNWGLSRPGFEITNIEKMIELLSLYEEEFMNVISAPPGQTWSMEFNDLVVRFDSFQLRKFQYQMDINVANPVEIIQ